MRNAAANIQTIPRGTRNDNVIQLFPKDQPRRIDTLWDTVEPIALRVNTGEGGKSYRQSLEMFTREQRFAHAVLVYASETYEGGHYQFFFNSSGILWEDAMQGLREIGASECAEILSAAALRAGGYPPANRTERQKMLLQLSPRFADLDARFVNTDPLTPLEDYMKANRAAFYFTKAPI